MHKDDLETLRNLIAEFVLEYPEATASEDDLQIAIEVVCYDAGYIADGEWV